MVSTKASRGTLAFDNGALARINRNSQFKLQANCFLLTKGQVLVSGRQNVCTPSVKLSAAAPTSWCPWRTTAPPTFRSWRAR